MVAYLQDSALDDERLASKLQEHRAKGVSVPLMHEAMQKWYYKDPQGEIQGRLFHSTLSTECLPLPPDCVRR